METLRRTIQLAHVMKAWRATDGRRGHPGLPTDRDDPFDDTSASCATSPNARSSPRSPTASPTTSARSRPGRLADIVLWKPACFGVKPELVLKAGYPAWAPLGEGNATVERAEPTRYRPDWGGSGRAAARLSVTFVSARGAADPDFGAVGSRPADGPGPDRRTRGPDPRRPALNRATAPIEIDPIDGRVTLGGPAARGRAGRRSCRSTAATSCAEAGDRASSGPDVADREAVRERVGRVDDVAREPGDPGLAGDRRDDRRGTAPTVVSSRSRPVKTVPRIPSWRNVVAEREPALRRAGSPSAPRSRSRTASDRSRRSTSPGAPSRASPVETVTTLRRLFAGSWAGPDSWPIVIPAKPGCSGWTTGSCSRGGGLDHLGDPDDVGALVRRQAEAERARHRR